MKIYSESFRKWKFLLEAYQEKGDPVGESLYLNFNDSYAYFGNKDGFGRVKFYTEKELDTEVIPNFFISTTKFLNTATQYDYLNLNDSFLFTNGKDKFKISTIVDDDKIDCSFLQNEVFATQLTLQKDQLDLIVKALNFTSKDEPNVAYRNIFIQDKFICSLTSRTPLYESPISIEGDLFFSLNVAKTIIQIGSIAEGCTVNTGNKNKKIVSRNGEFEIVVSSSSDVVFPDNRKDNFIKGYSYGTTLKVSTDAFANTLASIAPYFKEVVNSKILITLSDDISFSVKDSSNEIERHMPFIEIDENLVGRSYAISGTKIVQALSVLKGKELFIELPTNDTSPVVNFYNEKDSAHVVIQRFRND